MTLKLVGLGHGAGGQLTSDLVREVFLRRLGNAYLETLSDSAVVPSPGGRLAMTTDGFVVTPLFFPGGDIGKLAVCGTINDLAVAGARPAYLTTSFIIEEGLPVDDLVRVVDSMAAAAAAGGVAVVAGDTKVVERGGCDGLFIVTAGVGHIPPGVDLGPARVRPGDRLVLNGPVGNHGVAVLSCRPGVGFTTSVRSDCAPVADLTGLLLDRLGPAVRWMRDPTRGGLATVAVELGEEAGVAVLLEESAVPVSPAVQGACEILGLDPLYLANEGKVLAVVAEEAAAEAVTLLKEAGHTQASVVGRVEGLDVSSPADRAGGSRRPARLRPVPAAEAAGPEWGPPWAVLGPGAYLRTPYGGTKPLLRLTGDQLPRIC